MRATLSTEGVLIFKRRAGKKMRERALGRNWNKTRNAKNETPILSIR
jgi:hypothetical protein